MVTPAGKELLKNTIHTAKFHNRILEENDMWRQWELEKGLTMMVSDDAIRKKGHHRCRYHEKKRKTKLEKIRHKSRRKDGCLSQTFQIKKWDHSGFAELYPDEVKDDTKKAAIVEKRVKRKRNYDSSHSDSSSDIHPISSDEDAWEEFRCSKQSSRNAKASHSKDKKHKKYHKHKRKKK